MIYERIIGGDKTYVETTSSDETMGTVIMDGEYMYTIDSENKSVIKMPLNESANEITSKIIKEGDVDVDNLVAGTHKIGDKTYETEELTIDDTKSILCFEGDKLAYIIGESEGMENIIKIVKYSKDVDESLFEIPKDYQVMEM